MKRTTAIIAAISTATLAACDLPTYTETAQAQCKNIGYDQSSPEYIGCVERRYTEIRKADERAVAATMIAAGIYAY